MSFKKISAILCIVLLCASCKRERKPELYEWKSMEVTATAYNSLPGQTSLIHPKIAAWGDTLKTQMKCIAVSRDLIVKGLTHNTMVRIDTFPDTFLVKDKMHRRWRNRIDIYMGNNKQKALEWGRRKVILHYAIKRDSVPLKTDNP